MKIPHPFPYQGSKRNLASSILRFFPAALDTLYEPFAGSGAVTIAAACQSLSNTFVLNDLNEPLTNLWREIIERPFEVADAYAELWDGQDGREREFYDHVRCKFNQTKRPDYLLYLLARCVKASVRYNSNGDFNQSPDNRRKGMNPDTMRNQIYNVSKLLKDKTSCISVDYKAASNPVTEQDLVYLDPPYQGVCSNRDSRYIESVAFDDFVSYLETLNKRNISFIVSYDGRTGDKVFGKTLPAFLRLHHIELNAGRSSQATLLGRPHDTIESLYISDALIERLRNTPKRNLFEAVELWEMGATA